MSQFLHLTDSEVTRLFEKAFNSESGTASDGCGNRFTDEELYYEDQERYARKWFYAHRTGQLTQEMAECPPSRRSWEEFVN